MISAPKLHQAAKTPTRREPQKLAKQLIDQKNFWWAVTDSNRRPSRCKRHHLRFFAAKSTHYIAKISGTFRKHPLISAPKLHQHALAERIVG